MFSKESKVPPVFEMLQHFPYFTVLEPVCTVSQLRYYCTICVPHGEFTIPMWVCVFPALFPFSSRRCSFQCPAYRQTSHFQLFACLMQVQGFICFRSFFLPYFLPLFLISFFLFLAALHSLHSQSSESLITGPPGNSYHFLS